MVVAVAASPSSNDMLLHAPQFSWSHGGSAHETGRTMRFGLLDGVTGCLQPATLAGRLASTSFYVRRLSCAPPPALSSPARAQQAPGFERRRARYLLPTAGRDSLVWDEPSRAYASHHTPPPLPPPITGRSTVTSTYCCRIRGAFTLPHSSPHGWALDRRRRAYPHGSTPRATRHRWHSRHHRLQARLSLGCASRAFA